MEEAGLSVPLEAHLPPLGGSNFSLIFVPSCWSLFFFFLMSRVQVVGILVGVLNLGPSEKYFNILLHLLVRTDLCW